MGNVMLREVGSKGFVSLAFFVLFVLARACSVEPAYAQESITQIIPSAADRAAQSAIQSTRHGFSDQLRTAHGASRPLGMIAAYPKAAEAFGPFHPPGCIPALTTTTGPLLPSVEILASTLRAFGTAAVDRISSVAASHSQAHVPTTDPTECSNTWTSAYRDEATRSALNDEANRGNARRKYLTSVLERGLS